MTDITYEKVAAATPASVASRTTPQKKLWRRLFDRVVEARMRQAEQIVRQYHELADRR